MQRPSLRAATCILLALLSTAVSAWATPRVPDAVWKFYPPHPCQVNWTESPFFFKPSQFCVTCHPKQFSEWSGSVHSLAFWDPAYKRALLKTAGMPGPQGARACDGCHSPVGSLGGVTPGPVSRISDQALSGVFCDVCHSASGIDQAHSPLREPGGGPLTLVPVIESRDGPAFVKRGPFDPSRGCDGGYHQCLESGLHRGAEFCGSCHRSSAQQASTPLAGSYDQWERGPYARESILCQDCHMVDLATFKRSADYFVKPQRQEYRHYFSGANYLIDYLAARAAREEGDEELARSLASQYRMAVERLQSAADLALTPLYREGRLCELKVRVKNVRAGHDLPASQADTREIWLEISARDEGGKVIVARALPEQNGNLTGARIFEKSIPSHGFKEVYYALEVPAGVQRIAVEAKLRLRQEAGLLRGREPKGGSGADAELPLTVDMAVKQATLAAQAQ